MRKLTPNKKDRRMCAILSKMLPDLRYTSGVSGSEAFMAVCQRLGKLFPGFVHHGSYDEVEEMPCPLGSYEYAYVHTHLIDERLPSDRLWTQLNKILTPSGADIDIALYRGHENLCIASPYSKTVRCYKMKKVKSLEAAMPTILKLNKLSVKMLNKTASYTVTKNPKYLKMAKKLLYQSRKNLDKLVNGYFTCPQRRPLND